MSAKASGKVILLGEHAVVYGHPALALGIDRGVRAWVHPKEEGPSQLHLSGLRPVDAGDGPSDLSRAYQRLLSACPPPTPVDVKVDVQLPAGSGLGCSAALGVAIAKALASHQGERLDEDAAAAAANEWELVFHGNPSGIDATIASHGGAILFTRGEPAVQIGFPNPLQLVIGHTGTASSTRAMVKSVATLKERKPEVVQKAFEGIEALVRNGRICLEKGEIEALGELMHLNQMLLAGLFVSTPEIERMCELARSAGAAGAKLTGAGGGGCVVALAKDDGKAIAKAWRGEGFDAFTSQVTPRFWNAPACTHHHGPGHGL